LNLKKDKTEEWDEELKDSINSSLEESLDPDEPMKPINRLKSKIMDKLGMKPFDKVILSTKKQSKIKVMLPQAKRLGYTVKVHQILLIFTI